MPHETGSFLHDNSIISMKFIIGQQVFLTGGVYEGSMGIIREIRGMIWPYLVELEDGYTTVVDSWEMQPINGILYLKERHNL